MVGEKISEGDDGGAKKVGKVLLGERNTEEENEREKKERGKGGVGNEVFTGRSRNELVEPGRRVGEVEFSVEERIRKVDEVVIGSGPGRGEEIDEKAGGKEEKSG